MTVGLQRSKREVNRTTSPTAPSASSRRTVRKSPSQRRFWKTDSSTPAAAASRTSDAPSSASGASGLSTTTGTPAAIAARASGTWARLGAATTARSIVPGAAHSSSALATTRASGWSLRACAPRSGSPVTTAATAMSGSAATSGAWKTRPARPYPMIATRSATVRLPGRGWRPGTYRGVVARGPVSAMWQRNLAAQGEMATHMKTIFVIIGVVVIFGILFSSGGLAGGLCVQGVGCVRSDGGGGVKLDKTETVTISTGRP